MPYSSVKVGVVIVKYPDTPKIVLMVMVGLVGRYIILVTRRTGREMEIDVSNSLLRIFAVKVTPSTLHTPFWDLTTVQSPTTPIRTSDLF